MPNRILRDWTDSESVNSLSVNGERFFTRLIMKVDDFGRFSANTKMLKSSLYPLLDDIRDADITRWMAECQKAGLILVYEANLKPILQIENFKQTLRQKTEKYPAPKLNDTHTHSKSIADDIPETKRNEEEKKPETKHYIRLREKMILTKVSDYLRNNFQIFLEGWQMTNKQNLLETVMGKMDVDYNGYSFTNENHVQNTFKTTWDKVLKEKKDQPKSAITSYYDPKKD